MKVLLVNPPRYNGVSVIREERCEVTERYSVLEPYSLLQIASLLRNDNHNVSFIDLNGLDMGYDTLKDKIERTKPDAVLFRFTPTTFDHDMKTASIAKELNSDIHTGGLCWTLHTLGSQVMNEAPDLDAYITDEYEVASPALINSWENGDNISPGAITKHGYGGNIEAIKDYDSLPLPAYDLLPNLDPYFVTAPAGQPFSILYTSKGCPFKCSFCTVAGTPLKMKSSQKIIEELRYLKEHYSLRTASFFDETFTFNRKRTEEVCRLLKEEDLDIKWYCNTRAHLVDKELLEMMRSAGCRGVSFGIESGSQRILDSVGKNIKIDEAKNAIKWAKEAKIKTFCSFIMGLPGENWESVSETMRFVKETLPTSAQFNVAVPYPGTKLYEDTYGKDVPNTDFRKLYQDSAVTGTAELTPDDLNNAREAAYRALYTSGRWWGSNLKHVITEPSDLDLAFRYALKIVNNFVFHKMKDAH